MKADKFHAADYTASEVEAAKRVMIEVAQNLGEYSDACVVVGGWPNGGAWYCPTVASLR